MTARPVACVAISLLAIPVGASAQVCTGEMSFNQCAEALNGSARELADSANEDARDELATNLGDVNTGSTSGSGTTTDDFNPKLQISAETLGVSGEDGGGISLAWGDFIRKRARDAVAGGDDAVESTGQHHKLIVKLEDAELFEPLGDAITDPALGESFRQSLGDFDDVSADFRLSLDTERHGRNLQRHSDLIDAIQRPALGGLDTQATFAALDAEDRIVQNFGLSEADLDRPLEDVLPGPDVAPAIATIEAAHRALDDLSREFEGNLRARGFFSLVDLVNNQPQIVLSVEARVRDDLVGPDEQSLKLSYELGGANINGFKRFRANQQVLDAEREADERLCPDTSTCLLGYVDSKGGRVESGDRFSASLSFVSKDGYHFDDSGIALDLPSERSLVAELGYGRYLGSRVADMGAAGSSRVDLAVNYEDVKDDPARQNRTTARFTFSQGLSDGLFLTLGLVWANKPEYRGQVDQEISARAGINYKLGER